MPSNPGPLRPVDMLAPKGFICHPAVPAVSAARLSRTDRVIDRTGTALAPVRANDNYRREHRAAFVRGLLRRAADRRVPEVPGDERRSGRRASRADRIDRLTAPARNHALENLAAPLAYHRAAMPRFAASPRVLFTARSLLDRFEAAVRQGA